MKVVPMFQLLAMIFATTSACHCPRDYDDPVCSTDGKTYSNPCLFRCAQAKDDFLQLAYEGVC